MENFQLYRTNVFLGGQVKWDIILDSTNSMLYVSDFHLSPLSNNVPYTHKSDENLLNNIHQDNIKNYYKEIKSYFYSDAINSEYSHNWPIISKEDEIIDCYSNTYDMGCRRMKSYNLYKKQFEFLCPLWIEQLNEDIKFEITIKNIDSNTVISRNALILKENGLAIHDKFVKYFNTYISDAGLISGNDDLININFNRGTANATGLNVSTGVFETKNVDSVVSNLSLIERPLMETDNLIMSSFFNNHLIAKQLINFNLCFNIEDILSGSIIKLIAGKDLSVSINVYAGNSLLEKRDFYTEYEFINKEINSNGNNEKINVLDYLHDYDCLDLINKNKLSQNICHWSLCDNNDYIFNVYDGFSGVYIEELKDGSKSYYENDHHHGLTPNTSIKTADIGQNSTGWINTISTSYWNDFYKYVSATDSMKKNGTFIKDNVYINNIKYKNLPCFEKDGVYLIGIITTYDILSTIHDVYENLNLDLYEKINDNLYIVKKNDLIMLLTDNSDTMSFSKMKDVLYEAIKSGKSYSEKANNIIVSLYDMLSNKIDPDIVSFNSTILWQPTDGPTKETSELTYYKNKTNDFVLRYSGKIRPAFISANNTAKNSLYYKDYLPSSKISTSKYHKHIKTGYEPLYPSIDYFAINKFSKWSYYKLPLVKVSGHDKKVSPFKDHEYSWFNDGLVMFLIPEIKFKYINSIQDDGKYKDCLEIIKDYLCNLYNITDSDTINYIITKYDITNNWDYFSDKDINNYIYNITLKLK